MITNQLTSEDSLVGRDRGLANIVTKKYVALRVFGSVSGGRKMSGLLFGGVAVRDLKKVLALVPCLSRSVFGGLLKAEFFKFFYRGS